MPRGLALLICGVLLVALPIAAIASQYDIRDTDPHFQLKAALYPASDDKSLHVWTEMNVLDVTQLSGSDKFEAGDIIYVHMARGPDQIAYPFAITHVAASRPFDGLDFSLRGFVSQASETQIEVKYGFEHIMPSPNIAQSLQGSPAQNATVELAVARDDRPRISAVIIGQQRLPYKLRDQFSLRDLRP